MDYNTEFQNNNIELEEILNAITELPTANELIAEHNTDINAHSSLFATKANASDLNNYYTKIEIDTLELITIEDIDTIYGASLVAASEVEY